MTTSWFFTIFWIIYYPVCVAFYAQVHFDWSDEILTLLLIFFGINKGIFKKGYNVVPMKEVRVYIMLMAFYVIYSLIMAVNVSDSVWNDLQQQIRPYAVFYTTWMLRPDFTEKQKKIILWVMLGTLALYVPQVNMAIHDAPVGQLSLGCGMAYYIFRPKTKRNMWISIAIVAVGIIGGKAKFVGELVAFVALVMFLHGRIKWKSHKTAIQITVLATAILYFTWTTFESYFVSGWDDDQNRRARPELYKTAITMLGDYFPFGSGLGTYCCAASSRYYSPIYPKYGLDHVWGLGNYQMGFHMDSFYPNLAQYGIFGICFFIAFWRRRMQQVNQLPDERYYKMGLMAILALLLEGVADQSYLSGKGMGYWMILGLCVSSVAHYEEEEDGEEEKEAGDDEQLESVCQKRIEYSS